MQIKHPLPYYLTIILLSNSMIFFCIGSIIPNSNTHVNDRWHTEYWSWQCLWTWELYWIITNVKYSILYSEGCFILYCIITNVKIQYSSEGCFIVRTIGYRKNGSTKFLTNLRLTFLANASTFTLTSSVVSYQLAMSLDR